MTATYSRQVARFVADNDYSTFSVMTGIIAIILLMALLIEREMLNAFFPHPRRFRAVRCLNVAVFPLLCIFAVTLVLRFLELLT